MWDVLLVKSLYLNYFDRKTHLFIYSPTKEQFLACLTPYGKSKMSIVARKNAKARKGYIRVKFK